MNTIDLLRMFFTFPTPEAVFEHFATLQPGVQPTGQGDRSFLYLPGNRPDRVLLVAHADTVWDEQLGFPPKVLEEEGVLRSGDPALGLGADDRAGCAAIWALRDLGHSLLITGGEEKGLLGAKYLRDEHSSLYQDLNSSHRFAVQFDRQQGQQFKCYAVGSDEFRAYVEAKTGYHEPDRLRGSDISVLCGTICGVNLSIGYRDEHTPQETQSIAEWEHTVQVSRRWLSEANLPRFERPLA